MVHTIEIKVRGYHLDVYGHVNNARYLEFLEEARWAAVEDKMDLMEWASRGLVFSVVNININYRSPAFLNSLLIIETELVKVGGRSAVIHQTVKQKDNDAVVVDADVTFVISDTRTQKAVVLEGEVLEAIEALKK